MRYTKGSDSTKAQRDYLKRLGIPHSISISKDEAAKLLDEYNIKKRYNFKRKGHFKENIKPQK